MIFEKQTKLEYVKTYLSIKRRLEIKPIIYEFEIDIILGIHLNGNKGSSKNTSTKISIF